MHYLIIILSCFFFSSGISATQPSAVAPGRLVLLLHEAQNLGSENPAKKEYGPITMRAAQAIAQKAGILFLSPAIWENLLFRRQWFASQLEHEGSLASLFYRAVKSGDSQAAARQEPLLATDPTLEQGLFVHELNLREEEWRCWYERESSVVILIPQSYLTEHGALTPRHVPSDYTREEFATGLRLSLCTPLTLPADTTALDPLIRHAKHMRKRSTFSADALTRLFIPRQYLNPLLTTHWTIYLTGHGTYHAPEDEWAHLSNASSNATSTPANTVIAGLPFATFAALLAWCNKNLQVTCWYYQSCYASTQSLDALYHALKTGKDTLRQGFQLHFPLIAGALSEAPVQTALLEPLNLPLFFQRAASGNASWAETLQPITPALSTVADTHGLSNTPLVLFPGNPEATPIDVLPPYFPAASTTAHSSLRAGICIFTDTQEQQAHLHHRHCVVRGDRALLLGPSQIRVPLEIHRYQRIEKTAGGDRSVFMLPALVSLLPGNALHHSLSCTIHEGGLKDLLTECFFQITRQKSTKCFLFDTLVVDNDLENNFVGATPSWWEKVTETVSGWFGTRRAPHAVPRLVLRDVLIIAGPALITCLFKRETDKKAGKIICAKPPEGADAPTQLTLTHISEKTHASLYKKYLSLCAKQRTLARPTVPANDTSR